MITWLKMMKQSKFPLNQLPCLFYISKPQDATSRSLLYTLFFKVAQYLCISYHFYNLKSVKKTGGGVILLVKLHASAYKYIVKTICFRRFVHMLQC